MKDRIIALKRLVWLGEGPIYQAELLREFCGEIWTLSTFSFNFIWIYRAELMHREGECPVMFKFSKMNFLKNDQEMPYKNEYC